MKSPCLGQNVEKPTDFQKVFSRRAFMATWFLGACFSTLSWTDQSSSVDVAAQYSIIIVVYFLVATHAELELKYQCSW
eukprot:m.90335 g.90335  ORF g.90335 m.90335 type:complete len:78 (+) comp11841_c0_seq1:159-392(+)